MQVEAAVGQVACIGDLPLSEPSEVVDADDVSAGELHEAVDPALDGRHGEPAAVSDVVPLTPREREVVNLIAEGLSNRVIAERLVLSVRTVDGHVERILAKLEVATRTQITTWALSRTMD